MSSIKSKPKMIHKKVFLNMNPGVDIIAATEEAKTTRSCIILDVKGKSKESVSLRPRLPKSIGFKKRETHNSSSSSKEPDDPHWPPSYDLDSSFAYKLQKVDDMREVTKQDFDDKLMAIEIKLLTMDNKLAQIMEMIKKINNYFI